MATVAEGAVRADTFWQRMAIGLAAFIFIGFLQFALRGISDPIGAPPWVHLHGIAMFGWLSLLVIQPRLVAQDNLALHRRLGWVGAGLATVIFGLALYTGAAAVMLHRQPPFFSAPYFLALNLVEASTFATLVYWAIRRRRQTAWHRRLMLGSTIALLGPALGRLLPMPLMIGWADLPIGLCQFIATGFIIAHDRRTIGRIHPATIAILVVIVVERLLPNLLAMLPQVVELTERMSSL